MSISEQQRNSENDKLRNNSLCLIQYERRYRTIIIAVKADGYGDYKLYITQR